jgi:GTP pyrophosphokinase
MEKYRKMLLFMAQDVRVILIKLADRLHNMRTLEYLDPDDRVRISRETLDVFAPLAHRLGIAKMKWELEDLCLRYMDPEAYAFLGKQIALSRSEREQYIEEFTGPLRKKLAEAGIEADVSGRAKHFYSVYMKMSRQQRPIEDIYDLMAIRVLTENVADCYKALGVIHAIYTPVIDRIKDFIATPKKNMYRSLHTTVIGPRGEMVEIQIRTREMHKTAEEGIAAHWRYKEGGRTDEELERQLAWLRQTLEWCRDLTDPNEFIQSLKADLYHHEIFVFTPKGDLKNLPQGATPLDFAFAVHTEVGNRCCGAKVNGRLVSLDCELSNGDTVEIMTQAGAEPSIDWLHIVKTASARSKIRKYLKLRGFRESAGAGRAMLERQFKKQHKDFPTEKQLQELAGSFGRSDPEHLFFSVGCGELSSIQVLRKLHPLEEAPREARKRVRGRPDTGVTVEGLGDIVIRFSQCCQPVPGDDVVGLVTVGRGISVHRKTCRNIRDKDLPEDRLVEVSWDTDHGQAFPVQVSVTAADRRSLLADLARAIGDEGANILKTGMISRGTECTGTFSMMVRDLVQLRAVMASLGKVSGVHRVTRKGDPVG